MGFKNKFFFKGNGSLIIDYRIKNIMYIVFNIILNLFFKLMGFFEVKN